MAVTEIDLGAVVGRGIVSTAITYQASTSQTIAPTGTWSASIPTLTISAPYLWTRVVYSYTDGTTDTVYSVSSIALSDDYVTATEVDRKIEVAIAEALNSARGYTWETIWSSTTGEYILDEDDSRKTIPVNLVAIIKDVSIDFIRIKFGNLVDENDYMILSRKDGNTFQSGYGLAPYGDKNDGVTSVYGYRMYFTINGFSVDGAYIQMHNSTYEGKGAGAENKRIFEIQVMRNGVSFESV